MSIPGFSADVTLARRSEFPYLGRTLARARPDVVVPQNIPCYFIWFCHGRHLYLHVECEGAGD
jgi:hypothetical protein